MSTEIRDRYAETLGLCLNGPASDGRGWFRSAAERIDCYRHADQLLAVRDEEIEQLRAEQNALKAELAAIKDAEPTPCPVDHLCEGEQSCGCWCDLHDVPIAYCPTFMLVHSWTESRDRELAEARAAIERVRMLCTQAQKPDLGSWPMPADVDCDDVLAALDASQRPEDTRCPTPCDDDCDAACHEDHQPSWKRTHVPEDTRDEYGHLPDCPSGSQFLGEDPACHCARTGVSAEGDGQ